MAVLSATSKYPIPSPLVNVSNFVSIKLSKSNYKVWETQMFCFIQSMDMVGFIDGTYPQPLEENSDNVYWVKSDRILKGWILGSLSDDVVACVMRCNAARDVWRKLQSCCGSSSNEYRRTKGREYDGEEQKEAGMKEELDISMYLPLYKASLRGDWESARDFLYENPDGYIAPITSNWQRALHVAVGTGKAINFVKELVELMPMGTLGLQTNEGNTSLSIAAMVGNTQAARVLVKKDPTLLDIRNSNGSLPLHIAAEYAHIDTLLYLLTTTEDYKSSLAIVFRPDPFAAQSGVKLLVGVITSGFIDVSLYLVQRYPHLARLQLKSGESPLTAITRRDSAFPSVTHLNFWESFIYFCSSMTLYDYFYGQYYYDDGSCASFELRNRLLRGRGDYYGSGQRGNQFLWKLGRFIVTHVIHPKKLVHHEALQLVKCLCKAIVLLNDQHSYRQQCEKAILLAAKLGINEVLEEIVERFPNEVSCNNEERHNIFQLAVKYRCERVFNLVYQMSGHKYSFSGLKDTSYNNILHLAGKLAPPHKLNLVSGEALQMQREMQWFKEVEKFVNPACKAEENSCKETPQMVFTREHKNLMLQGEKWMKDTANSCTIAAALIATVVFAAAITVPGCNSSSTSLTIFSQNTAFAIFSASDVISLFTSTTALLMFLSILTARFAEQDFLYSLPKRLIIGLCTLFISITSMMIAATLYLVFAQNKAWILGAVVAMAALPVIAFVFLQFPLLIDVISSTYGGGIFGKQSNRPFY